LEYILKKKGLSMNVGELWVANPAFPWLVVILALWITISTISQSRNWSRIRKLEKEIGRARENKIRTKEREAAIIEDTDEDGNLIGSSESQDPEETESASRQADGAKW